MRDDFMRSLMGFPFGVEREKQPESESEQAVQAAKKAYGSLAPLLSAAAAHPEIAPDLYGRCCTVALAMASHFRDAATAAMTEREHNVDAEGKR